MSYRIAEVTKKGERSIVVAGCDSLTKARDMVMYAVLHREIDTNVAKILVEDGEGNVVSELEKKKGNTWVEKADSASLFSGKRIGAVVVFKADVSRARAMEMLNKLARQGWIEVAKMEEFEPEKGWPIWYIP